MNSYLKIIGLIFETFLIGLFSALAFFSLMFGMFEAAITFILINIMILQVASTNYLMQIHRIYNQNIKDQKAQGGQHK